MKLTQDEIKFLIACIEDTNDFTFDEKKEADKIKSKLQQEVHVRIENWAMVADPTQILDPYTPPECMQRCLSGDVYGHPEHTDGERVTTSHIQDAYVEEGIKMIRTSNRVYVLGDVRPEYEAAFPDWEQKLFKIVHKDRESKVLKTARRWAHERGITIMDPDGWRKNDGVDLNTHISEEDFDERVRVSTVSDLKKQPMDLGYVMCGKETPTGPCVLEQNHEGKCES